MKYAHLADAHLGSWRDPKMRDLSTQAFLSAIDDCLQKQVDFILFAGDLFNTSLPPLDILKTVTKKLKQLHQHSIPFYAIPGSHDFSPSGKTMLDVLENAGLLTNVCRGEPHPQTRQLNLKFTVDKKTGAKLTGMLGKKGMLDKAYYEDLNREPLEKEEGYKLFLFHTALSELKPKHLEKIDSQPLSFLPKNFHYYAGGHIHHRTEHQQKEYGTFTYPGPLFPNNFMELEKYSHGGYYLIEVNEQQTDAQVENKQDNKISSGGWGWVGGQEESNLLSQPRQAYSQKITWLPIKIINHLPVKLDCSRQTPEVIALDILNRLDQDLTNTLITIRLTGTLDKGRASDIDFKQIFAQLYKKNAYFVMKNTSQLQSEEFEELKIETSSPEQLEEEIIKEHLQQIKLFDQETEFHLTKSLLHSLNTEKKEGETIRDFQQRVREELNNLLNLGNEMEE